MIDDVKRRAGPFSTEGQSGFPFTFAVFKATDVAVLLASSSDDLNPDTLVYGTDYTVELNDDQNAAPGGTVTLTTPLAAGSTLSIVSAVPYTQPTQLTNYSRFPPEILNKSLDRLEVQIQQLFERLDRAIVVSPTSTKTAEEFKQELLDLALHAAEYVEEAKKTYEAVLETQKQIDTLKEEQEKALEDKADELKGEMEDLADSEVDRVEKTADWGLSEIGLSCQEGSWTVQEDLAVGSVVDLPEGMRYLVDHKHMQIAWNGLVLLRDKQWRELGAEMEISTQFSTLVPLHVGDVLQAWIVPLGARDYIDDISTLYKDLKQTQSKVAYADLSDESEETFTYPPEVTGESTDTTGA
ncbi:MAG: hypothetical protein SOT69_10760 [Mesosutterella sp.]|nr:hypothetical protein [Mesosutterella sp.]